MESGGQICDESRMPAIFCERVVVYKHIHVEVDFSSAATQLRLRHLCRSINSPLCFGNEMDHVFQMADVMLPDGK